MSPSRARGVLLGPPWAPVVISVGSVLPSPLQDRLAPPVWSIRWPSLFLVQRCHGRGLREVGTGSRVWPPPDGTSGLAATPWCHLRESPLQPQPQTFAVAKERKKHLTQRSSSVFPEKATAAWGRRLPVPLLGVWGLGEQFWAGVCGQKSAELVGHEIWEL